MAYTSWGTRKALGRRYAIDPALTLEQQRLENEAALIPGRESRALQSSQFDRQLAQTEENQKNAATSGMVGTGVNAALTGMMINKMYGGNSSVPAATVKPGVNPATVDTGMGLNATGTTGNYASVGSSIADEMNASTASGATASEASPMSGWGSITPAGYVIAAELGKNQWGQLEKGWDEKTPFARFASAPGVAASPASPLSYFAKEGTVVSNVGREFSRIEQQVLSPIDKILGISNPSGGTWLCTAVKRNVGLDVKERQAIRRLRRYAKQYHAKDLNEYQSTGCYLVDEIARNEPDLPKMYEIIKQELVVPVVDLVVNDDLELAFIKYKEETLKLFAKYLPGMELGEVA